MKRLKCNLSNERQSLATILIKSLLQLNSTIFQLFSFLINKCVYLNKFFLNVTGEVNHWIQG
jgi:hypothetical protein